MNGEHHGTNGKNICLWLWEYANVLLGLHNVLAMLIDLNFSQGIEFYRVEDKQGRQLKYLPRERQWYSTPSLPDSDKAGPTNCLVPCFIIQLITETSRTEQWCLGTGKGLPRNKTRMFSSTVVPLSCREGEFPFSMRKICILVFQTIILYSLSDPRMIGPVYVMQLQHIYHMCSSLSMEASPGTLQFSLSPLNYMGVTAFMCSFF